MGRILVADDHDALRRGLARGLAEAGHEIEEASNGNAAINNQTGFLTDCAVSFWTADSGTYWNSIISDDPDALSICASNATSDWSDSPDGPFVEKGAVAEVMRRGNTTGDVHL